MPAPPREHLEIIRAAFAIVGDLRTKEQTKCVACRAVDLAQMVVEEAFVCGLLSGILAGKQRLPLCRTHFSLLDALRASSAPLVHFDVR
jgi:hypothetical protein